MKYYNSEGNPFKSKMWTYKEGKKVRVKSGVEFYYDEDGNLTRVPTITDGKDDMLRFIKVCVGESHPDVSLEDLKELWDEQMEKMHLIIHYLEDIRDQQDNRFKINAYNRAINILSNLKYPIVSGKQAKELRGIGDSIAQKIDTALSMKTHKFAKSVLEKTKSIELFKSIWKVGTVTANKWYNQGYRSLEDIKKYEWDSLNKSQQLTIKFHDFLTQPIPREAITNQKEFWEVILFGIDSNAKIEIVGSYRRGLPYSGDVDILISSKKGSKILNEYVDALIEDGHVVHVLQRQKEKITTLSQMFMGPDIIKMDFFFAPPEGWGAGMIAWTGSGEFDKSLRGDAARKGYKLNATGLTNRKTGRVIPTPTEKSVFKALNMKYVLPKDRY